MPWSGASTGIGYVRSKERQRNAARNATRRRQVRDSTISATDDQNHRGPCSAATSRRSPTTAAALLRSANSGEQLLPLLTEDRKSTRLNSSHVETSYAVFCLTKKMRTGVSSSSVRHA